MQAWLGNLGFISIMIWFEETSTDVNDCAAPFGMEQLGLYSTFVLLCGLFVLLWF